MHLVNCLFVGAGAAAAAYAADLDDTPLSVTGVCDLDPERADAVAETLDTGVGRARPRPGPCAGVCTRRPATPRTAAGRPVVGRRSTR